MQSRTIGDAGPIAAWLEKMLRAYERDRYSFENHFRPQVEFRVADCEFFRQEDGFGEGLVARIEERTGLQMRNRKIEAHNVDASAPLEAGEIGAIESRVRDFYRDDYEAFNY
jgi:hypothetical protein